MIKTVRPNALKKYMEEKGPIRVGMIGTGYIGRPLTYQITQFMPEVRIVGIASHKLADAIQAYQEAGVEDVAKINSLGELERAIAAEKQVASRRWVDVVPC